MTLDVHRWLQFRAPVVVMLRGQRGSLILLRNKRILNATAVSNKVICQLTVEQPWQKPCYVCRNFGHEGYDCSEL